MSLVDGAAEVVEIDTRRLPALLDVTSEPPGATIAIGGKAKGTTPTTISGIAPGRVTVRLSRPGCEPFKQSVKLRKATITPLRVLMTCAGQ